MEIKEKDLWINLCGLILSSAGIVYFVTICNTFPNAYDIDENGNPLR